MEEETTLKFLSQQQAEQRFQWLQQGSISYKLHLRYNKGELFQGQLEAKFVLLENFKQENELFFDFQGQTIHSIYVNGVKLENIVYDGLFIIISGKFLKLNSENTVFISYQNKYANDGNGLHSFVDQDKKQYLYSQCEAFFCNKIFPVFDQPDLKATLALEVDAPKDWVVLFNTNEDDSVRQSNQFDQIYQEESQKFQGQNQPDYVHHSFPRTLTLSSYLWGFIAGPFCKISNPKSYKNIPMNIYVRESLVQYAQKQSEFIFEITDKCLEEYEKFFGYEFAFPKYDQVFCPEFNCGAMENSGIVTFNDEQIFKEEVEATRLTSHSNTIAHEIAHHWFGNLVTMKWWDGLWLNESFADFISHFILSKVNITSRKTSNIWVLFNQRKGWGYRADQLVTTHPIAGEVINTEEAESIFDGITYAKGAASLRQIMSLMGEENFSKALKSYFNTFAFKNATLNDFIGKLNEQFSNPDFTLQEWQELWLTKSGLNECEPTFDPSNNSSQAKFIVKQTVALPQHPTLRMHKMKVAFFSENGDITEQNILVKPQSETEITYDGSKNYKACLLNYQDEAFVKVILDKHSLNFFKENLHKVQDLLTRTLIWRTFFDMTRDGKISSEEYIDIFLNAINKEESNDIIQNQLSFITSALSAYTPNKYQEALGDRLFEFMLNYLKNIEKSNTQRFVIARNKLFFFAKSDKSIDQLVKWYNGEDESLKGMEFGLKNQWNLVSKVHRSPNYSLEFKNQIFEKQSQIDKSDTQNNMRIKCSALIATPEERKRLFSVYLDKNQKEFSLRQIEYSMIGFNNDKKKEELQEYYEKWYELLEFYTNNFSKDQLLSFYDNLFPETDNVEEQIQRLQQKLQATEGKQEFVYLRKLIGESIDDLQRKSRCFKCFYERAPIATQSKL